MTQQRVYPPQATTSIKGISRFVFKSEMEGENSGMVVTPDRVKDSPGVAKSHGVFSGAGTPAFGGTPYNAASITDNGAGDWSVNFSANMNDASYTVTALGFCDPATSALSFVGVKDKSVSAVRIVCQTSAGVGYDNTNINFACFGKAA